MKASEAINVLEHMINKHGDLDLKVLSDDDIGGHSPNVDIAVEWVWNVEGDVVKNNLSFLVLSAPKE